MNSGVNTSCSQQSVYLPHPGEEGDSSAVGELTAWYVEPGEKVAAGELLFQVSWPGVVIEYTAEQAGVMLKRCRKLREQVRPDELVCELQSLESNLSR